LEDHSVSHYGIYRINDRGDATLNATVLTYTKINDAGKALL